VPTLELVPSPRMPTKNAKVRRREYGGSFYALPSNPF
jgi:hypothetical protein